MKSRTYRFTNKDPVNDEIMMMVDESGLKGKAHIGRIAQLSTLAYGTVYGILYGDTKRPQNATVMSIATALGFERKWQRTTNKFDLETQLIDAKLYIKAERARMAKESPPKKKRVKKTKLRLVKGVA
jgi:hypothetical protein